MADLDRYAGYLFILVLVTTYTIVLRKHWVLSVIFGASIVVSAWGKL